MKKLVCLKEVEELCKNGLKVFNIEEGTIITPSAKDFAKNNSIEFVVGCQCSNAVANAAPAQDAVCNSSNKAPIDSDLIYSVLQKMISNGNFNEFLGKFMKEQNYLSETDPCGFKVIRGNTVKFEALDTGNPADAGKVYYQELIGADSGSPMNAGFMTIERCNFDWDVGIHEIYYIIEGTLTVTINGKVYTAYPGDSIYAPKGSKVAWGSPDKVKVFYVTY